MLAKNVKIFLKKKKKKSNNMMMNVTKISQKMKPLKKKYYRMRKMPYYNYKKLLFKKKIT